MRLRICRNNDRIRLTLMGDSDRNQNPAAKHNRRAPDRALLAAIVDSSDDAIISKTLEGVITSWNAAAQRIFGYSPEEALGNPITMLIPPDRLDEETEILRRIRLGDRIEHFESIRLTKYGTQVPISLTVSAVRDDSGAIVGASKIARDITAQRQAEQALAASEAKYRRLIETLPAAVFQCDLDGRITTFNDAAVEIWGCEPVSTTGQWCGSVSLFRKDGAELPRDEYPAAICLLKHRSIPITEIVVKRPDGTRRTVLQHSDPIFDEDDVIVGVVSVMNDITDQKLAEAALRYSEEKFRNLADNMSQFAWMADENWWIYWYNRRWFDYTGTTLDDMQGWGWKEVHHPDHVDRVVASVKAAWKSGQPWEDVFPLRSAAGEYRWYLSRAEPIRDETGRVVRWFGTNTDITEQRETEAALQAAKDEAEAANQAKDQFLAILSHELRTPLTPVLMLASTIESDTSLPEQVRRDAAMIRDNVRLETKLIDDLLDLSRITAGKLALHPETVDLNESLLHVCEMCADQFREKSLRLHCNLDEQVGHVSADSARLHQVIWNVLKNAAKFTPEFGEIFVSTAKLSNGHYRVVVRDNGAGIEAESLSRIFDAFEQGSDQTAQQFGGLGLGLAISKALVELHGGSICASSPGVDQGATFTIDLPAVQPAIKAHPEVTPSPAVDSERPIRLLLVEDHAGTSGTLQRILRAQGYAVNAVATKAAALEYAAEHEFDVMISDIGLPDGTGYEILAALRRTRPIRAIAISGYGMAEDIRRSREAGFTEHLIKPLDTSQLDVAIRQVVSAPPFAE